MHKLLQNTLSHKNTDTDKSIQYENLILQVNFNGKIQSQKYEQRIGSYLITREEFNCMNQIIYSSLNSIPSTSLHTINSPNYSCFSTLTLYFLTDSLSTFVYSLSFISVVMFSHPNFYSNFLSASSYQQINSQHHNMKNKLNLHYLKNPIVSIGLFLQIATLITYLWMVRNGAYRGVMSDQESYAIAGGCGLILGCIIYKYFLDEDCVEGEHIYQRLLSRQVSQINYFDRYERQQAQDLL